MRFQNLHTDRHRAAGGVNPTFDVALKLGAVSDQVPGDATTFKPTFTAPLMPGALTLVKSVPSVAAFERPLPAVMV